MGAGPGDPDLLTLRAAELLARADCVIYDRLVNPAVLSRVRAGARLIFAGELPQEEIHRLLIAQARLGREVVRLKGGDPFVFGRGGEEALALRRAGLPFEVVPGVSSGIAAPAYAGIPVTQRGIAGEVTFATAYRAQGSPNWTHLAKAETLVLFMAGRRLSASCAALCNAGRAGKTPAAVIEAGTWRHQKVIEGTLATIARRARDAGAGSPLLLVVGEVVALRAQLGGWVEQAQAQCAPGRAQTPFPPLRRAPEQRELARPGALRRRP